MKISQIVITRVEEPVDAPQGEVFKVTVFDGKGVVDQWHFGSESDVIDCIRGELEDLVSQ